LDTERIYIIKIVFSFIQINFKSNITSKFPTYLIKYIFYKKAFNYAYLLCYSNMLIYVNLYDIISVCLFRHAINTIYKWYKKGEDNMEENNKVVELSIKINSDGTYEVEGETTNKVKETLIKLCAEKYGLLIVPRGVFTKPVQEVLEFFEELNG